MLNQKPKIIQHNHPRYDLNHLVIHSIFTGRVNIKIKTDQAQLAIVLDSKCGSNYDTSFDEAF
jgi:hypothetical protein